MSEVCGVVGSDFTALARVELADLVVDLVEGRGRDVGAAIGLRYHPDFREILTGSRLKVKLHRLNLEWHPRSALLILMRNV